MSNLNKALRCLLLSFVFLALTALICQPSPLCAGMIYQFNAKANPGTYSGLSDFALRYDDADGDNLFSLDELIPGTFTGMTWNHPGGVDVLHYTDITAVPINGWFSPLTDGAGFMDVPGVWHFTNGLDSTTWFGDFWTYSQRMIEDWKLISDGGQGSGKLTLIKTQAGTVTADGDWIYTYKGAEVSGSYSDASVTIVGSSISMMASGTATNPSAPEGYQGSPFTLSISGKAYNGNGSGTYTYTFTRFGWPRKISGSWEGLRTIGSGITAISDSGVDPAWSNYNGDDGTNAVVAVQGSNTFVAYSNQAGNNGRVEMYNSRGIQLPVYDLGDLQGGQVKAIAVSGSTVYVAGYKGTAGSGTEVVFAVAYKASSKGLTILWEQESPAIPNAGKYRIGIKALGSKAVMFYNTDSGTESSVRGKVLGLDPKTGAIKWGPYDYGDPDHANKVNAIAIKGSQFAAVGFKESGGNKFFNYSIFSAVNGGPITEQGFGGAENEALAVSWVGSYLGVVGQVSGAHLQGFFWGLKVSKTSAVEVLTDSADQGSDTKMNAVVIKGANAYAGGHGKDADSVESALVRAYNLAPGTPSKPGGGIWSHATSLGFPGGVVTTGLALGKKGVYLAGYGKSDIADTPANKNWVVEAWDLEGKPTWERKGVNLNVGLFDQALDIAVGAKAVIAVGQVQNGAGPIIAGVQAYTP